MTNSWAQSSQAAKYSCMLAAAGLFPLGGAWASEVDETPRVELAAVADATGVPLVPGAVPDRSAAPARIETVRVVEYRLAASSLAYGPTDGATSTTITNVEPSDPRLAAAESALGEEGMRRLAERRGFVRREVAFHVLNAVDAVQTMAFVADGVEELNPLLGKHPSTGKLLAFKAAGGLLHYVGTRYLRRHHPEQVKTFQIASVAIMGGVVAWNARLMF